MICQKCGKYNDDGNKFCNYCGATLSEDESTNTPLTGSDRLKIGWLFALLIIPFGGFGMAIIPLLILWSSIYVMKKDKSFSPILNAKNYLIIYLTLLALGLFIGVIDAYQFWSDYESYSSARHIRERNFILTGIILAFPLLIFIFNILFFNILEKHQKWVINNGIFADADTTYSDISCSNCGHKLKSQGGFCPNCGHKE